MKLKLKRIVVDIYIGWNFFIEYILHLHVALSSPPPPIHVINNLKVTLFRYLPKKKIFFFATFYFFIFFLWGENVAMNHRLILTKKKKRQLRHFLLLTSYTKLATTSKEFFLKIFPSLFISFKIICMYVCMYVCNLYVLLIQRDKFLFCPSPYPCPCPSLHFTSISPLLLTFLLQQYFKTFIVIRVMRKKTMS